MQAEQAFRKEIGSGLLLFLSPLKSVDTSGFGWEIEIQPTGGSDNFARCVTGPCAGRLRQTFWRGNSSPK